jgi:hypothetical protein
MKVSSLLLSLSILLVSGKTYAGVESDAEVSQLVKTALLKPLEQRENERGRFSRVAMPPTARHVRVLEGGPEKDPRGRTFVRFAVDEKRHTAWARNAVVGCAYPDEGAVFIQRGEKVQSAARYLGQRGPAATTECTAATVSSNR